MKFIAKDLKEWWALPDWPDDASIDDDAYTVNGEEVDPTAFDVTKLADSDTVDILCGSIIRGDTGKDLARTISRWLKERDSVTLVVRAPKAREPEIRAAIKALGCEVLK